MQLAKVCAYSVALDNGTNYVILCPSYSPSVPDISTVCH